MVMWVIIYNENMTSVHHHNNQLSSTCRPTSSKLLCTATITTTHGTIVLTMLLLLFMKYFFLGKVIMTGTQSIESDIFDVNKSLSILYQGKEITANKVIKAPSMSQW